MYSAVQDLKLEGEPKLVLIQVSKVLVELAKRLWPQCWKTFIDDVIMSFQIGVSVKQHMVD